MSKIRVLRILEYIGEETQVWHTLRNGGVPANGEMGPENTGGLIIKSGIIGFPELTRVEIPERGSEND